jgi:riboflavin-specific deaminase-like protein
MDSLDPATLDPITWEHLLERRADSAATAPLYAPFIAPLSVAGGGFVLGRIAQSLDGRIATRSGRSRWISGDDDLLHTHRLRALSDAVIVGAGTVRTDDPLLTTRLVEGPSPVRVVIDPARSLDARYRLFEDGPPVLLVCADDAPGPDRLGAARVLRVPARERRLEPRAILAALAAEGLRRVVVEGGGITVSRFLAAGALDRLHVTVAPLLLGSGIPGFTLPEARHPADGLRLAWQVHRIGDDLLLDIPLERTLAAA